MAPYFIDADRRGYTVLCVASLDYLAKPSNTDDIEAAFSRAEGAVEVNAGVGNHPCI